MINEKEMAAVIIKLANKTFINNENKKKCAMVMVELVDCIKLIDIDSLKQEVHKEYVSEIPEQLKGYINNKK